MQKRWWWSTFLLSLWLIFAGCAAPGAPAPAVIPEPILPEFAWPPPHASAFAIVPFDFLLRGVKPVYLSDIEQRISKALEVGGYVEKAYYAVPDGFAIVTRLEQIEADGTSLDGLMRWSTEVASRPKFSVGEYLRALFFAPRGYYRIIVFVVTPHPFSQTSAKVSREEAMDWLQEGTNKLPSAFADKLYTSTYTCTALIYEFEQPGVGEPAYLKIDQVPTGIQHLQKAHLWYALVLQLIRFE